MTLANMSDPLPLVSDYQKKRYCLPESLQKTKRFNNIVTILNFQILHGV